MGENQFLHIEKDACGANELIGTMMQIGSVQTENGDSMRKEC